MRSGSSDWLKKQEVSTFHTHFNSHSTTNDQSKQQTVSGWTNQNLSSWWGQQGLDNQWWAAENSPISTALCDKQSPFCQAIDLIQEEMLSVLILVCKIHHSPFMAYYYYPSQTIANLNIEELKMSLNIYVNKGLETNAITIQRNYWHFRARGMKHEPQHSAKHVSSCKTINIQLTLIHLSDVSVDHSRSTSDLTVDSRHHAEFHHLQTHTSLMKPALLL